MSMIKAIQRKTASSEKGAKGLVKGVIACAFQNLAFMLPTSLLYFLVADMLSGGVTGGRIRFYVGGIAVCFALIPLGFNITIPILRLTKRAEKDGLV